MPSVLRSPLGLGRSLWPPEIVITRVFYLYWFALLIPDKTISLNMCSTTQWRLTRHEVQHVVTEFDLDGNGLIDFHEFLVLIKTVVRRVHASLEEVVRILRLKCAARKPIDLVRIARCHNPDNA